MVRLSKVEKDRIGTSALFLGIYFMAMPFDSFLVAGFGSLAKAFILLPIIAVLMEGNRYFYFGKLTKIFVLYCIYFTLSLLYSIDFNVSSTSLQALLLNAAAILCLTGLRTKYTEKEVLFLKMALVIGGLATIFLTLLFPTTGESGRLSIGFGDGMQDQNYLNGYILFAFTAFVINVFRKKALYVIPVLGIVTFVLFTGSRGALLAYFCVAVLVSSYILFKRGNAIRIILLLALVIITIFLSLDYVLTFLPQSVVLRFTPEYILDHADSGRVVLWRYFLNYFKESSLLRQLFGYGFGASGVLNHLGGTFFGLRAHNLFVDHLIMGGIIGEVLFVVMVYHYLRAAFRTKDLFLIGSYFGFIIMMLSLSLLSYKPIWNCMIMIIIITRNQQVTYINDSKVISPIDRFG